VAQISAPGAVANANLGDIIANPTSAARADWVSCWQPPCLIVGPLGLPPDGRQEARRRRTP
jgi:hypothetical protein